MKFELIIENNKIKIIVTNGIRHLTDLANQKENIDLINSTNENYLELHMNGNSNCPIQ